MFISQTSITANNAKLETEDFTHCRAALYHLYSGTIVCDTHASL